MTVGMKKYCQIALENMTNSLCFVDDNFHCMILLDEKRVPKSDPPFLNRFEKQRLILNEVLRNCHKNIIESLNQWLNDIILYLPEDVEEKL